MKNPVENTEAHVHMDKTTERNSGCHAGNNVCGADSMDTGRKTPLFSLPVFPCGSISFSGFAVLLLILSASLLAGTAEAASHAVARSAAPVLNSPGFGGVFGAGDGRTLKTDSCGQVREMEFVALPGTVFRLVGESRRGGEIIYRVETDEYPVPSGSALYLDSRFLELWEEAPVPRKPRLPARQEITSAMKSAVGSPYVWGGNLGSGIPELLRFYYKGSFSSNDKKRLSLAGLDCSGLLYEATNGWTPRNTSALVRYGDSVPVAGKGAQEISAMLEPLDLIVWNGHVLIVLDRETVIESRLECGRPGNGGVMVSPLVKRLNGIMKTRKGVNVWPSGGRKRDLFVVRRWYPM